MSPTLQALTQPGITKMGSLDQSCVVVLTLCFENSSHLIQLKSRPSFCFDVGDIRSKKQNKLVLGKIVGQDMSISLSVAAMKVSDRNLKLLRAYVQNSIAENLLTLFLPYLILRNYLYHLMSSSI
jgi:hypothetical protein